MLEIKLKISDYFSIILDLLFATIFFIISISFTPMVIGSFSMEGICISIVALLFALFIFFIVYKTLSCNCRSLIVDTENKLFTLILKKGTRVQIPFSDIKKIYAEKYSLGGEPVLCREPLLRINILTQHNILYTIASKDYKILCSHLPEEMINAN